MPWVPFLCVCACGALVRFVVRPMLTNRFGTAIRPSAPYWVLFLCTLAIAAVMLVLNEEPSAQGVAAAAFFLLAIATAVDLLQRHDP